MSLRQKLMGSLVGLVIFLAITLTAISLISMQSLMGHTVTYIEDNFTQEWTRTLTSYYEQKGSWNGLHEYLGKVFNEESSKEIQPPRSMPSVLVFDQENTVVDGSNSQDVGKKLTDLGQQEVIQKEWLEIQVKDQAVGHFWINHNFLDGVSRLTRDIGNTIIRSMLIGLVLTSFLALLLGILLARRFTIPLRQLAKGVEQVAKGDLTTHLPVKGRDEIAVLGNALNSMTEQLARNEEVRRNMVADIAHELRTPLSVIVGKLESIQEGVLPLNPATLLPIQDEAIRMIRLVRDLQQLSLAEAGKLPLTLREIDLRDLLSKIFEQFEFEFEERKVSGQIVGEAGPILGDADRLTQVFVNLVGNALLHTPEGGHITVRLAKGLPDSLSKPVKKNGEEGDPVIQDRTGWVKIMVEDDGEGIPEEEIKHIFNRFYRVDKARVRESGGTGLGLAIASEFVLAHGGQIFPESVLGQGTCFIVLLPTGKFPDSVNNQVRSKEHEHEERD